MKKKILIVCNSNFVYEKFIHEQKIFLQKKGYEIDVLIGEKKNIKKKTLDSFYFVDIPQNKINFVVQDVLNFRSMSDVRTIHALTFGLNYKFSKTF